ncbi:hypothetical protein SESBI_15756 [Sesbania bispinosa]|nr:hypothetical protein SESBI_15756 [Sesbania bispinosa]
MYEVEGRSSTLLKERILDARFSKSRDKVRRCSRSVSSTRDFQSRGTKSDVARGAYPQREIFKVEGQSPTLPEERILDARFSKSRDKARRCLRSVSSTQDFRSRRIKPDIAEKF